MKHKDKVKLARSMQSKEEATTKGSRLFGSKAWLKRREMIEVRVMTNNRVNREKATKRREAKKI